MKLFAATLGIALLAFAGGSQASQSTEGGYINEIYVMDEGAVLFSVSGGRTSLPACQGPGLDGRWAFNGSTPQGQAKLSAIMSAYAMHKRIVVLGKGVCTDWGDTETVLYFRIFD